MIEEPKFEEIRIFTGRIVKLNNYQNNDFFVKLLKIPPGMLSRKSNDLSDVVEKSISHDINIEGITCKERHLAELPGLVEIEVIFDKTKKLIEKPFKIAVPVCQISLLSNQDEVAFEKTLLKSDQYKKINAKNELDILFNEFEVLIKYNENPKTLNELNMDEAKILLNKLQFTYPVQLDHLAKIVEDNEENIMKINIIQGCLNKLVPNLTLHIRALSFMKK
jgi:hypothetical protein